MGVIFHSLFLMAIHSTVTDDTLIEVAQQPEHGISVVGANITFKCSFAIRPNNTRINVYWSKQGEHEYLQAKADNRKIFGVEDKGIYFFQLLDVNLQDSGVYYCEVIREGRKAGNGSGSRLTVGLPPTPLQLLHTSSGKYSSALNLVCKTAVFYPRGLIFNWYKNGTIISTGMNTTEQQNPDGLYQASSSIEVAPIIQSGTVYTCMVSHSSLRMEGIVNSMIFLPDLEFGYDVNRLRFTSCVFAILFLVIITVDHFRILPL